MIPNPGFGGRGAAPRVLSGFGLPLPPAWIWDLSPTQGGIWDSEPPCWIWDLEPSPKVCPAGPCPLNGKNGINNGIKKWIIPAIPAGNEPGRAAGMARTCRDSHFYYYGIKFALSAYATLFSILGLLILGVGIYAEAERQRHRTLEGIFLAPAVLLLLLGITVFLVSFVGMLGSLRDNRTLLRTFFWVLLLIFLTELLLILMEIIFESKMNEVFHSNIQEGIRHYYDDLDFKNILDFVQEKFSCCGGDEFRDWEVNQYHACNGSGALACGVPHSCCVRGVPGGVVNTLCGYRALDKERLELLGTIHVRGCIHAVGLWLKDNFQATLAIVCSLLLPQVLGLAMAWLHWQQLNEIHSRLDSVDSRLLQSRDLSFASLDLRGAGWCWCLPREGGYIPVNPGEDEEEETACHSKV